MARITLTIEDGLAEKLNRRADSERRSISSCAATLLEEALATAQKREEAMAKAKTVVEIMGEESANSEFGAILEKLSEGAAARGTAQ